MVFMIMVPAYSLLPDPHPLGLTARALLVSLIAVDKVVEATEIYSGFEPWVFRFLFSKLKPKLTANRVATHAMSKLRRKSLQDLLSNV